MFGTGYLVPQPFAAGGNWVVTGGPRYPGYMTSIFFSF
jgi:hypothetical protein